jgi:hypothetical protein
LSHPCPANWRLIRADNRPLRGGAQASVRDPKQTSIDARFLIFAQLSPTYEAAPSLSSPCQSRLRCSTPDQTAAGRTDRSSSRLRRNADGTACSMSLRLSNIGRTVVGRHMSLQGMPAADWGASTGFARAQVTIEGHTKVFDLDGRFASISAPIAEHPCIGKLMPDRAHTSLRSERSRIRTSPRHRCPYSRSRSTPGRSFLME